MGNIEAGILQGSLLDPLLFFIYIKDLPDYLVSIAKPLADYASFFSVKNANLSAKDLNIHLAKISNCAFQ